LRGLSASGERGYTIRNDCNEDVTAAMLCNQASAIVPSAAIAFAGDFVETARPGSLEGAALSGLRTAEALAPLLISGKL